MRNAGFKSKIEFRVPYSQQYGVSRVSRVGYTLLDLTHRASISHHAISESGRGQSFEFH